MFTRIFPYQMATDHTPVEITVRREMALEAVKWVCRRLAFTIDRDHMNRRSIAERLDDGIMGEIASIAIMQYLSDIGRQVIAYDQIRQDKYQEHDPGWDVLVSTGADLDKWGEVTLNPKVKPDLSCSISVKSSRIPKADNDDIQVAVNKRDFKIFKRSSSIIDDLTADFEAQVYYSLAKSQFNRQWAITKEQLETQDYEFILNELHIMERYAECYICGIASKEVIGKYSDSLSRKSWGSMHDGHNKEMWIAPLRIGVSLRSLTPKV